MFVNININWILRKYCIQLYVVITIIINIFCDINMEEDLYVYEDGRAVVHSDRERGILHIDPKRNCVRHSFNPVRILHYNCIGLAG